MAKFDYVGRLTGEQSAGFIRRVITNSATIKIGGLVKLVAGYASAATSGAAVIGVCRGFETVDGLDLEYHPSKASGTLVSGVSYAAASDNVTVNKVRAVIEVDREGLYKHTTGGALTEVMVGNFFDISSDVLAVYNTSRAGILTGSATYDTASLADAAGATTTITVTGAALGDFVKVSLGVDLAGISVTGYVSATDTVAIRIQNESGGTLDLASTTVAVEVTPKTRGVLQLMKLNPEVDANTGTFRIALHQFNALG